MEGNPAGTIQLLEQKIRESFNLPPDENLFALNLIDSGDMLKVGLDFSRAFGGALNIDLDLSDFIGDFTGLPPMLIHVGSDEILLDDARRVVARARTVGVEASVGVHEGMWHVFQAFPGLPESRWALREIGGFIRRHIGDVASEVAR